MPEELDQLRPLRFPFAFEVDALQGEPEASSKSNSVKADYFEWPRELRSALVLLPFRRQHGLAEARCNDLVRTRSCVRRADDLAGWLNFEVAQQPNTMLFQCEIG